MGQATAPFQIVEATIDSIHSAYKSGPLTCRRLVQAYIESLPTNKPAPLEASLNFHKF